MVRRVSTGRGVIDKEWLIGLDRLLLTNPTDRLIGHVFGEVIPIFLGCIDNSDAIASATQRINKILEAKYTPADLAKLAQINAHLTAEQQESLLETLNERKELFDGSLSKWKGTQYHVELKEGVKPYHARPYAVPHTYERTLRSEVERLCSAGVLNKINRSKWAALTFIIPKRFFLYL